MLIIVSSYHDRKFSKRFKSTIFILKQKIKPILLGFLLWRFEDYIIQEVFDAGVGENNEDIQRI